REQERSDVGDQTMLRFALCVVGVLAVAHLTGQAVCAQAKDETQKKKSLEGPFKELDTDGDGKVSKAEADADFKKVDANGDGYIDLEEVIKQRGAGKKDDADLRKRAQARIKDLDANGDGKVSKAEADASFKRFDLNGDGFIDAAEAAKALALPGVKTRLEGSFKVLDLDGDGKISKAEADA